MRRRHVAAALAAVVLMLPMTARAQTPTCGPTTCAEFPPNGFLATANAEVPGDSGGYTWTTPLGHGSTSILHEDVFSPVEPAHTLRVVQGDVLSFRFDPPVVVNSLTVRRGTTIDAPPSALHEVKTSAGNAPQFVADFQPGTWDLTVSAEFAQGNVGYFFKLDVGPRAATPTTPVGAPAMPVAAPATPVASHPNFTG